MSRTPVIHNAGSLNIDDVFRTAHIVRPGETIPSHTLDRFPGGKGLNQSTALARSGARVRHVGKIGKDGVFLKDGLEADGADVSGIIVGSVPTGHAIIQVTDRTAPGAASAIYAKMYPLYQELYPALRPNFNAVAQIETQA